MDIQNNQEKIMVTKSSMPDMQEYIREIESIWDSHWLTNMGPKHNELCNRLKAYLEVENIELLVNGHMALEMTLQAMDLTGEVITTPFTFASTTHAIVRNGLKPVFCDIKGDDYTLDPETIESHITDETSAIVPVHVYGNICDVNAIQKIADKHGLKVIYDAAHAFGETFDGENVGNYGDASIFSFHATKVFNTIEGGAVTFHDKKLGEKIYDLKNFGIHGEEDVPAVGANAKMNEFCAAMGICNLRNVDAEISKRKIVYERYYRNLDSVKGITLNCDQHGLKRNYSYFPVVIDPIRFGKDRNAIYERMKTKGIYTRKYFYPLTSCFSSFNGKFNSFDTPIATDISNNILCLPMYADLTIEQVDYICKELLED